MTDRIPCAHCSAPLGEDDITDTTESNINTSRAKVGDHTGDIYTCQKCNGHTLDDYLTGEIRAWVY